jgi:hypothetical protein
VELQDRRIDPSAPYQRFRPLYSKHAKVKLEHVGRSAQTCTIFSLVVANDRCFNATTEIMAMGLKVLAPSYYW